MDEGPEELINCPYQREAGQLKWQGESSSLSVSDVPKGLACEATLGHVHICTSYMQHTRHPDAPYCTLRCLYFSEPCIYVCMLGARVFEGEYIAEC